MGRKILFLGICGTLWLAGGTAQSQTLDLSKGAADPIWLGTAAGSLAGDRLDQGALSSGDSRRDLVVAAPGSATISGTVYVIFGGPVRTGSPSLSTADTILNGAAAGDQFGFAMAIGNVLNAEGSVPKTLVVGAPGSASQAGAVYVFAGGFRNGDVLNTSDAVVRILGRSGDRLGHSLASADLNNDGYREIIIGAPGAGTPGAGRIYVIQGGPALAGTIDLATTPAAVTIEYPGLGGYLQAGDITGDGIYDLLVGHPSNNAVHFMRGQNGTMPTALEMSFLGIDAGDGVGTSIRLADVDADGVSDVIVGAAGGDGPANSRPDAGEAYLIWGGAGIGNRSMAAADVIFYGSEAGGRFGALVTGGNIRRDVPDDLVFVAPGAGGGAGSMAVYYGRSRRSIGVLQADGTRVVDFSTEAPSRSILGDATAGTITAAIVYEVTGEGARDVLVGISGDNESTGAVYFTISPRLRLGTSTVALSGLQGIVSSSPVPVRNISEIPITWRTSSDRSWLSATAEGSTSATAFGDLVITVNGEGLLPGVHTGRITVTSTSEHLMMSQAIDVTFEVGETQPTPASPPAAGYPSGARYKILWRHTTDGWLAFWNMDGLTLLNSSSVSVNQMTDASWRIAGMGDVNGDGDRDIVWQNGANGMLAAWLLRGNTVIWGGVLSISAVSDRNWRIRGVGDTNGDGKADLVWQHATSGGLAVWYMDGANVRGTQMLSIATQPDPNWQIRAVGDTNGDGRADLLWGRAGTGDLAVWFLNGTRVTGTSMLSIPRVSDPAWELVGSCDVSGDGKADLLWQHSSGALAAWYLDGRTVTATSMLNPSTATSAEWRVAGPK